VHAAGAPQVPASEQISTPLAAHWVVPKVQTPRHAPPLQVCPEHGTGAPQTPASQVSTPFIEHCVLDGTQTPVQAPPSQMYGHAAPVLIQ
jgi:hypothetical protein